jgi:hypothetical protein
MEIPVNIKLHNQGASPISLSELDFSLRMQDVHNTLPDFNLVPLVYPVTQPPSPPAHESQNGDSYYFWLNSLNATNTIPAGGSITILTTSVLPPPGQGNLLGEAEVQLEFLRLNISGGSCCELSVPSTKEIVFPGELYCDVSMQPFTEFQLLPIGQGLQPCESGFKIEAEIMDLLGYPSNIYVDELFFEFKTISTGSLQVTTVNVNGGISSSVSCTQTPCPPGVSSPLGCLECRTTISFVKTGNNPPILISNGDESQIILSGLNGDLHQIDLVRSKIKRTNTSVACIPAVDSVSNAPSLPMLNSCNFCSNATIFAAPYQTSPLIPALEPCEAGFSVALNVSSNPVKLDEIVIEFDLMTSGVGSVSNVVVTPIDFCNSPPGCSCSHTYNNGRVTVHLCPDYAFSGTKHLVNVRYTSSGGMACVEGIAFTMDTKLLLPLIGECAPVVEAPTPGIFPACSSCFSTNHAIGGAITEGNGDLVQVDNAPAGEGIFIRDIGEITTNPPCNSNPVDCQEFVTSTSPCGSYELDFDCRSNYYVVEPRRDDNILNGVTTFDLVLISKHVLGPPNPQLDSPYKMIAADVNRENGITTADMVAIRRVILLLTNEFPNNNTSWRFVDPNHVFPTPFNPSSDIFPECRTVDLSSQIEAGDIDFIGIKIGDVNNSANGCQSFTSDPIEERSSGVSLFIGNNQKTKTDEIIEIQLFLQSEADLVAWQMGLNFDPAILEFLEAVPGDLDGISPGDFGLTQVKEGKLRAIWTAPKAKPYAFNRGIRLFNLRFKALRPIEQAENLLATNDETLMTAAFEDNGAAKHIRLKTGEEFEQFMGMKAAQLPETLTVTASPNPFSGEITFNVAVPEASPVELMVFDPVGRLALRWKGQTEKGHNAFTFDQAKAWTKGIYTYQLNTDTQAVSGVLSKQ